MKLLEKTFNFSKINKYTFLMKIYVLNEIKYLLTFLKRSIKCSFLINQF